MLWLHLSLLTAISLSITDALSKYALKNSSTELIAWVRFSFATPFFFIIILLKNDPLNTDPTFWLTITMALPLEVIATLLYMRAIKISPLSLTIPFLGLTPVFLIVTSFVLLGEVPDSSGLVGILLVAAGAYSLNFKVIKNGFMAPIKAIKAEKGSILMIIVSFIYSITSTLGKIAVIHSSPILFGAIYSLLLSIALLPFVLLSKKRSLETFKLKPALFILIGAASSIMMLSHWNAIIMTDVSYMIAIKRTSMIFSVLLGWMFFKEKNLRERIVGTLLIIVGVVFISS